jgi:hypothetical protein
MALLKWVFEYRENEKRIDKFKERINEEFEKKGSKHSFNKKFKRKHGRMQKEKNIHQPRHL